ncbi:MAG: hypothetical protein OEV78_08095 [Spirochaetia bacterium]|nr:hypothetical protein [Spirochaetia bacterium]
MINHSIKKYIFIGLEDRQINLVKSLNDEYEKIHEEIYFIFMPGMDELFYHIDVNSIVVSNSNLTHQIIDIMLQLGHPFYLSWSEFLQHYHNLLNLQLKPNGRKVCIAFISENFNKIYRTIFSFYGYNTISTADPADLEQIMSSGIEYLVFDMDMHQASENTRFQTMRMISSYCKKGLKVNVIKNFDQGSLFNDILSPVKEISNILLSPEEYMLFLRKYLYTNDLEKFYKDNPERISAFQNTRYNIENKNSRENKTEFFFDMRDAKKCYNQILTLKRNPKWYELLQIKSDIELKFLLSMTIENFVSQNMENSQRELFTFFPQ